MIRAASASRTRLLLLGGVLAGPFYVLVGLGQILLRPGFDIHRHALSLMSNGNLGWIQVGNFIISGCLVIAGALGVRRALAPGRAGTWGPLLLGVYGLGLIGAGLLVADPMDGFPLGTPPGPPAVTSWHGPYHFVAGGIGFFGLIAACFVFARRYFGAGRPGWAVFSMLTGLLFFGAFGLIGSGSKDPSVVPIFTGAVVLTWSWLSAVSSQLRQEVGA
ncbi:MAG: DUF998 domain-containing protein [Gemmatimonadota bacterium]